MKFLSFDKLEKIGIPRPSLAPEGYKYWSKLYPNMREKRDQVFTTIRAKKSCYAYKVGTVIPIYLDHKEEKWKLFDAKIVGIKDIKKIDISENLARGDADMTVKELWDMIDFFYKKKYGNNPELIKITMRAIKTW